VRAIILAGGKGARLAPLTEVIPKPLVPIKGKPILELVIQRLKAHGFRRITLAVGYLADLIRAYFQDGSKWGVELDYSYEEVPLGTAGPLALIDRLDDTFLVMNADVLTTIDYTDLLRYHRANRSLATVGAVERQAQIDFGVIVRDGNNLIKDYLEKPTSRYLVSMGIYVFEPQVLTFIQPNQYLDFPELVKLLLQANVPVHYYNFTGYWLDIGRHEDYAAACTEIEAVMGNNMPV
jgi:NDP-sugar pyrophosphorylase family protein